MVETGGAIVSMSAQDLLNLASLKLLQIGEPLPSITPGGIVPVASSAGIVQPGEWVSIYGANLASGTATWTGRFPHVPRRHQRVDRRQSGLPGVRQPRAD